MIKKIIFTLSIIVLGLFINPDVYADDADRNPQLIYDIIELNISNTDINFEGWAFINDIDNNKRDSIDKAKSNKDVTISIVGKQQDNKTGKYIDVIEVPVTSYNGKYNKYLYESNCMKWSSAYGTNELSNCIETYEESTCGVVGNITDVPSCRQDDIGFNVSIKIDDLKKVNKNNNPIFFYIKLHDHQKKSGKEYWEKSIGVNDKSVKGNTTTTDIKIGGFSKKARIETSQGRVLNIVENNGIDKVEFKHGNDYVWKQLNSFEIIDTYELKNSKKFGTLKMYKLKYYTNITGEYRAGRVFGEKIDNSYKEETGWAHAGWISIEGQVYIIFDNVTNCPPETKIIDNDECNETSYNETRNYVLSKEFEATENDHPNLSLLGDCNLYIRKTLRGEISVNQTGNFVIDIDKKTIKSGMGFSIAAGYNGRMTYNICHETEDIPELAYTIIYSYEDKDTKQCLLGTYIKEITDKNSPEWQWFAEEAKKKLSDPSNAQKTMMSYDSDEYNIKNNKTSIINSWTPKYTDGNGDNKWMPGEEITYILNFDLDNACINVQDATIRYTTEECDPAKEINGNKLYYIPLKYMKENFPVWVSVSNLNMLKGNIWDLNYSCNVKTTQKLYDEDYSYKFIYRPISLSNPFPNRIDKVKNNQNHNWYLLINDQNAFSKVMTRDNLEYQITLTPQIISQIKNYNKINKYTSFNDMYSNGISKFLNDYNITRSSTIVYNELGKCESGKNCWNKISLNVVEE